MEEVLAAFRWTTNADLIRDVARLGYLNKDDVVMDATYGEGVFWGRWRPNTLIAHDLYKLDGVDFRDLPEDDRSVDVAVFDPRYKLSGTPALGDFDYRYGCDVVTPWKRVMLDMELGLAECARVSRDRILMKCQDQVCSGKVRWQTDIFTRQAEALGFEKIDRFDMLGTGRPQPADRSQKHAHGRPSTLLVFKRVKAKKGDQ